MPRTRRWAGDCIIPAACRATARTCCSCRSRRWRVRLRQPHLRADVAPHAAARPSCSSRTSRSPRRAAIAVAEARVEAVVPAYAAGRIETAVIAVRREPAARQPAPLRNAELARLKQQLGRRHLDWIEPTHALAGRFVVACAKGRCGHRSSCRPKPSPASRSSRWSRSPPDKLRWKTSSSPSISSICWPTLWKPSLATTRCDGRLSGRTEAMNRFTPGLLGGPAHHRLGRFGGVTLPPPGREHGRSRTRPRLR